MNAEWVGSDGSWRMSAGSTWMDTVAAISPSLDFHGKFYWHIGSKVDGGLTKNGNRLQGWVDTAEEAKAIIEEILL